MEKDFLGLHRTNCTYVPAFSVTNFIVRCAIQYVQCACKFPLIRQPIAPKQKVNLLKFATIGTKINEILNKELQNEYKLLYCWY